MVFKASSDDIFSGLKMINVRLIEEPAVSDHLRVKRANSAFALDMFLRSCR